MFEALAGDCGGRDGGRDGSEGAVVKYVSRWKEKGGVEDLEKARHLLSLLIESERAKQDDL